MVKGLEIPFDRVTYRDGQLLTAGDMQADTNRNSRLWDLHTRYLHATWGIAIGFVVNTPNPGDTVLQVGAGYAVDSLGRPLVSSRTVVIPVPLIVGTEYQVLVINYQANSAYRDRLASDGICFGTSSEEEHPSFNWKTPADVQMGVDVPLITVQVNAGAVQTSDTRVRRFVQKLQRPYIAAGATDQGSALWSILSNAAPTGFTLYQTSVDTTDAAFNNTPYYFPELHMWNNAPQAVYGVTNSAANSDFIDFTGPFTTCLTNPTPTSFTFQLIVPSAAGSSVADPNASGWSVSWMGIEIAECIPLPSWIVNIILNSPRLFPFTLLERPVLL